MSEWLKPTAAALVLRPRLLVRRAGVLVWGAESCIFACSGLSKLRRPRCPSIITTLPTLVSLRVPLGLSPDQIWISTPSAAAVFHHPVSNLQGARGIEVVEAFRHPGRHGLLTLANPDLSPLVSLGMRGLLTGTGNVLSGRTSSC